MKDVVDELHKILADPNGIASLPQSYNADSGIKKNPVGLNESPDEEESKDDQISERRLLQPDVKKDLGKVSPDKAGSAELA